MFSLAISDGLVVTPSRNAQFVRLADLFQIGRVDKEFHDSGNFYDFLKYENFVTVVSCNILFSTVWLSSVLRYSFSAKTAMAFHHSRKLSGLSALFRLGCSGNRNGRKIRCLLAATESPSWIMKENDGTVGGYAFGSFLEEHSGMSPFLEPMKIRFENCGSIVSGSSGGKSLPY